MSALNALLDAWSAATEEDRHQFLAALPPSPLPVPELDIWRSANVLIQYFGAEASQIATRRTLGFLDQGDLDGATVWRAITRATDTLMTEGGTAH